MTKDELYGTNKEQDNKPKTDQKSGSASGAASGATPPRPAAPVFAPRGPMLAPPAPHPRGMPMMPQARNLSPVVKPAAKPGLQTVTTSSAPPPAAPKKPDDNE